MKKLKINNVIKIFLISTFCLLLLGGIILIRDISLGDPDQDKRYYRDVRVDSWSRLFRSDMGILYVQKKLENMYGHNASKIPVDMANLNYSEGNWHYEFAHLAEESIKQQEYLDAFGYYSIASFPHLHNDNLAKEMYMLGLDNFKLALIKNSIPHEIITVNIDGIDIEAYLVLPESYKEGDSFPVVIGTGGADGLMAFMFADYLLELNKNNIAWVGFDMPGNGTSAELVIKSGESLDDIHVAVIKELQKKQFIDDKNIFIYGRSLAGYNGLRMVCSGVADELDLGGVIVAPAGEYLFGNNRLLLNYIGMSECTKSYWSDRIGIEKINFLNVYRATKALKLPMSNKEFWIKSDTSIPLLVMNTADDQMNPVSEVIEMSELSSNGEYVIAWDEEGHLPSRQFAIERVVEFVQENIR